MNSNGFFNFIVVLVLVFSGTSFSQEEGAAETAAPVAADATDLFYICKRDKSIRWLRAYKLENGKCQTHYSKEGYLQVISSATYFSMCEGVLHSVQKNLEEGGFKCSLTSKYSVIELE